MELITVIAVIAVSTCAMLVLYIIRIKSAKPASQEVSIALAPYAPEEAQCIQIDEDSTLLIGDDPANPIVTISNFNFTETIKASSSIVETDSMLIARLSTLTSLIPQGVVSSTYNSGKYMLVSVNGNLAAASDGIGFRGFVKSGGSIKQHAKLFESSNLSNVISAAAIWQIASVIVAQKHLADISKKLTDIKEGVNRIADFLDSQRKSQISGSITYLEQAFISIQNGERGPSVRNRIEHIEITLCSIHNHLIEELAAKGQSLIATQHDELFGSKDYYNKLKERQASIGNTLSPLVLNTQARAACWQLLTAFCGESHLKQARLDSIQDSITVADKVVADINNAVATKVNTLNASWTTNKDLEDRKSDLLSRQQRQIALYKSSVSDINQQISQASLAIDELSRPVSIAVKVENGKILEAYRVEDD